MPFRASSPHERAGGFGSLQLAGVRVQSPISDASLVKSCPSACRAYCGHQVNLCSLSLGAPGKQRPLPTTSGHLEVEAERSPTSQSWALAHRPSPWLRWSLGFLGCRSGNKHGQLCSALPTERCPVNAGSRQKVEPGILPCVGSSLLPPGETESQ